MIRAIQNFIFKGMLLRNELDELEGIGTLVKNELGITQKDSDLSISLEDFNSSIRINAIKMADVYVAFFCFENSIRNLITERLKERVGANWWSKCVSNPIKKEVLNRKGKDTKNKWHAPRSPEDIAYTDFGDMTNIICNNWIHFSDLFPNQEWVRTRLGDLEQSRNAIAHNNILAERDIKRIKMYLEDWVKQTG